MGYANDLHAELARQGHIVVFHVTTVAEALELISSGIIGGKIDLALLDRDLPDGNGATVATALREAHPSIPIVANSGYETTFGDYNIIKLRRPALLETIAKLGPGQ